MENEVRDTFIEALRQILAETDLAVEAFEPGPHPAAEDQVVASVGLTGDVKGILMLSLDARSAFAIARAMTGGVAIPLANEKFTDVHLAAMAELANQVSGRAITMLSGRQMRCDITPPAVIAARGIQSLVPNLALSFHRTACGAFGRVSMFLGFQARD
ncbi:MAG TPA: chemotaxis protein CheX [Spirochaetia bacterium]|nr:chemotaxis protein CheX [Spirochaetia bacterium]